MCADLQFAFFLPVALVYYRHLTLLQNVGIYLIFKDFIVFFPLLRHTAVIYLVPH